MADFTGRQIWEYLFAISFIAVGTSVLFFTNIQTQTNRITDGTFGIEVALWVAATICLYLIFRRRRRRTVKRWERISGLI